MEERKGERKREREEAYYSPISWLRKERRKEEKKRRKKGRKQRKDREWIRGKKTYVRVTLQESFRSKKSDRYFSIHFCNFTVIS